MTNGKRSAHVMDAIRDSSASEGIALAGQGRLEEAEACFRRLIRLQPDSAETHNLLAAVLAAQARGEEAIAHYRQALRLRPSFAAACSNLADTLTTQGQLGEALTCYEHALRLEPDSAQTHYSLGNALRSQGRHAESVRHYRRAQQLRPNTVEIHAKLAAGLAELGEHEHEEALAWARQALRLQGGSSGSFFDLGTAFLKLGQFVEASACFQQALQLQPDDPDTLNNLGTALWEQGRHAEAESRYRQAVQLRPGDFAARNNLGNALREQGKTEEAAACYRQALRLQGGSAEAHLNLGVVLSDLGALEEAAASLGRALELRPDWPAAFDHLGMTRSRQGKLDEALACYEHALHLQPDFPEAHRNRAMAWLAQGDLERGWPEYEWRWRCRGRPTSAFSQPRWEGDDLNGRTILLHAEQGLGDTLQFIRYAPLVKPRSGGGTVVLSCPQPLVRLLARCRGIDRVLAAGSSLPEFDVHAPLMSLPLILGTTLANVPADVPYLVTTAEAVARWEYALSPVAGFRTGIAWQGNPRYRSDRHRSFPLARLAPLARVPNVRLISLQFGAGTDQLPQLAGRFHVTDPGQCRGQPVGDFLDLAALVRTLDLVVTPDTAIAHLAGGLGVRVWLALSFVADWRWLTQRDDSPWYPTVRLFRQARPGDWDEVFERMADALEQELSTR
jgi:tetratricopeptide (TPR) repeat protein